MVSAALGGCTQYPARRAEIPPSPTPTTRKPITGTAPTTRFAVRRNRLDLRRDDRPLPTTIWSPRAEGRYPLILFSHGLTASPDGYETLLTAWARAGFVVAAPAYPHTSSGVREFNPLDVLNQPADASYVITQLVSRGKHDRIAAAGHSAGGITTIGLFTSARDERLRAGVVLAGRQVVPSPFTGAEVPLLFVHGRRDKTVAYAEGRAAYDALTWPKALLTFPDGGHEATGDELDVVAATSTEFWRWSLYGDGAAKSRIARDAGQGGLATLSNRL